MIEGIEYVVGAEMGLKEILPEADVLRLLKAAVGGGAARGEITDGNGRVLWEWGEAVTGDNRVSRPIFLEGERVGLMILTDAPGGEALSLRGLIETVIEALNVVLASNLKRMLTTETHTQVVNRSFEELLEKHKRLTESEARYRELAENLEKVVQERTEALQKTYARLLQREKMASVGQLAAGVAHEINNPMGFITSNLNTLAKYAALYQDMVAFCLETAAGTAGSGEAERLMQERWRALKMAFISRDTGELISQSLEGAERIKKIVSDLKGFSHVDQSENAIADLNVEIDRTLRVLAHLIPAGTRIERTYGPLPGFHCNPGLVSQVFLNILMNALEARRAGLKITIRTDYRAGFIRVAIEDNGPGIPEGIKDRIFDPFFTTKDVGEGTGMGLTVVYDIVNGMGGTIHVSSEPDKGAAFTLQFPVRRNQYE